MCIALKVRQFQNEFIKSSFTPKYERNIVRISAQVYLVSRHIPDRTQRWRWRSCFAVQQQKCFIKFWAINRTEFRRSTSKSRSEVGYGLIRGRTSAQIKTLRPFFLTLSTYYQNLSKYQVLLFRGIFQLSKLHFDNLGPGI